MEQEAPMNNEHEVEGDDMMPQTDDPAAPDAMEQAQMDAAEQRREGGGYGG
jgi:hypothetical protein